MEQSSNLLVDERDGNGADSLELTNHPQVELLDETTDPNEEMAALHRELGARTKSLEDALAERDVLKTTLALEKNVSRSLKSKYDKAKDDLQEAEEIAEGLRQVMSNPDCKVTYNNNGRSEEINKKMKEELKKANEELRNIRPKLANKTKEVDKLKAEKKDREGEESSSGLGKASPDAYWTSRRIGKENYLPRQRLHR